MGRTVTGAPYSGQEVTEETQTLSNGNVISRKITVNVYRDSSGRTRTERTVNENRPGQATTAQAHTVVTIHDPVAGTTSELDATTKTAHTMQIPGGRGNNGQRPNNGPRGNAAVNDGNRPARGPANDPNVTNENLGMQTINGVQATGTRVTRNIPAGQAGNAQPMQRVTETWHSPDLQVPVMTKISDPRNGTTTVQLTNITRSEPDSGLFQVPSDYTVSKGRGPRGGNNNAPVINQ